MATLCKTFANRATFLSIFCDFFKYKNSHSLLHKVSAFLPVAEQVPPLRLSFEMWSHVPPEMTTKAEATVATGATAELTWDFLKKELEGFQEICRQLEKGEKNVVLQYFCYICYKEL